MLAKDQDGNKKPKRKAKKPKRKAKKPQYAADLPHHRQHDNKHVKIHMASEPYNDVGDTVEQTRKKVKARAYSFSMEPPLYEHFRTLCIERGVNSSACVRNLIMLQMKSWRLGDHDESLAEED